MKTMKVALLATAALAAVSVSARADDTAAIKAQLEALTARIAQLEAAPAAPVGFSLLTVTKQDAEPIPGLTETEPGYINKKVTVISVMPTADVPATTTIEWSAYVRAAIVYHEFDDDEEDEYDVHAKTQLKVVGRTDTAVGEVGARLVIQGHWRDWDGSDNWSAKSDDGNAFFDEVWGWWAMTPELTLGGGKVGSLGNIGYGVDGACTCHETDNADIFLDPGSIQQLRLTWASGPMTAAVAVEEAGADKELGVAAEVKFSGDTVNGEIAGVWRDGGAYDDLWQVGAGIGFGFGDMFALSLGAATGEIGGSAIAVNEDYWVVSVLGTISLSESISAEIGGGFKDYDVSGDVTAIDVGLYYRPVSQLNIGVEGEWADTDGGDETFIAAFVTEFSF
jgi:hypothetical protein